MKTNINDIAVGAIKSIIQELESMGWRKPVSYAGYIYIMVNPGWSDKVKIGYADDLAKRVKNLSGTNVPDPYHCYAAYKVQNRLEDKEVHRLIDGFDSDLRYNDHKEFYMMSPERAYSILESIAKISGTIDCLELNPLNDEYFSSTIEDSSIKIEIEQNNDANATVKHIVTLSEMGIPSGSTLVCTETNEKCKLVDANKCKITVSNSSPMSLRKYCELRGITTEGPGKKFVRNIFTYNGLTINEHKRRYLNSK